MISCNGIVLPEKLISEKKIKQNSNYILLEGIFIDTNFYLNNKQCPIKLEIHELNDKRLIFFKNFFLKNKKPFFFNGELKLNDLGEFFIEVTFFDFTYMRIKSSDLEKKEKKENDDFFIDCGI